MVDSAERKNLASLEQKVHNINEIIKQSQEIGQGTPARYRLQSTTDTHEFGAYRQKTFGLRDNNKPHKSVLMVGETGAGKTTLINTMINYMLNITREDKVWFEITDEQTPQSDYESVQSQTSSITVYGVYRQEGTVDLTIIDTPGYGDTHNIERDEEIAKGLLSLSRCDCIHEIHTVCLVIKATENRLSDRQQYIFDAVQSLFGRDIAENIVLLFTHSNGSHPKNALKAVKAAQIKSAVNDENQPVFFLFDNCQLDTIDEEYDKDNEMRLDQSLNLSCKGMTQFFQCLDNLKPKTLQMTQDVLQERNQLDAKMSNLQSRVQLTEKKQKELKKTQDALEQNRKCDKKDFEVEVTYKEKVHIDPRRWRLTKKATCCTVCEENCHYPGCWWADNLSWCSVMKDDHCTVCTNKCHYSKHIKEDKIYVTKTRKETRTFEDLKKKYGVNTEDSESLDKKLKEELENLKTQKVSLLNEAFQCVEQLERIALNTDSVFTLQHIDYLIEKFKEINVPDKTVALENIKKRAGDQKKGALGYIKSFVFRGKK